MALNKHRVIPKPGMIRVNRQVSTPSVVAKRHTSMPRSVPRRPVRSSPARIQPARPTRTVRQPASRHNHGELLKRRSTKPQPSLLKRRVERQLEGQHDQIKRIKDCGVGRILVVVACGPSIKEVALNRLKGLSHVDVLSINKPDDRVWPTKYWVFCDKSQYNRNKKLFESYRGLIINPYSIKARSHDQVLLRTRSGKGWSRDLLSGVHIGRSTTYTTMQITNYMNYDKVYIFGCDMSIPETGPTHHYGDNPDVSRETRRKRFAKEAENFQHGASQMTNNERSRFVFCSLKNKWPFVKFFDVIEHTKAVDHIIDQHNNYYLPRKNVQ